MVLKFTGMIVILISSTLLGFSLSEEFLNRIEVLKSFKKSLLFLKGEIKHNNETINVAMSKIKLKNSTIKRFYQGVITNQKERKGSVQKAWDESVKKNLSETTKLSREELGCIEEFGSNLGITDRETQIRNIQECMDNIQEYINFLLEEKKEKCKIYKMLGVLLGAFISIILL